MVGFFVRILEESRGGWRYREASGDRLLVELVGMSGGCGALGFDYLSGEVAR